MNDVVQGQPEMTGRVTMKPTPAKHNLREQQRADVTLNVCIKNPAGEELSCTTANLSRAGVMISCDSDTVQKLVPTRTSPAPGQCIQVSARFAVPVVATQTVSVRAEGHIVHLRRVSRNEFHVGVHFTDFEDNGFDYLDQYVSRLLSAT